MRENRGIQPKVAEIRRINPSRHGVDIARDLNVSRQRVHQVLQELGLPTRIWIEHPARYCETCGKQLSVGTKGNLCLKCFGEAKKVPPVELTCPQCNKTFYRTGAYVRRSKKRNQKNFFCGTSCEISWLWKHGYIRR